MKFDLRFYSPSGFQAEYLLLDPETESKLFSCFLLHQGSYYDFVKSCQLTIGQQKKPQILLELDKEKIDSSATQINKEKGAKLKIIFIARNGELGFVAKTSQLAHRLMSSDDHAPRLRVL